MIQYINLQKIEMSISNFTKIKNKVIFYQKKNDKLEFLV